jgi:hypothetical protein
VAIRIIELLLVIVVFYSDTSFGNPSYIVAPSNNSHGPIVCNEMGEVAQGGPNFVSFHDPPLESPDQVISGGQRPETARVLIAGRNQGQIGATTASKKFREDKS